MKLIEKLSTDYAGRNYPYYMIGQKEAFEAGFRKCREMAANMLTKDYSCNICGANDKAMKKLGESEIE